MSRTPRINESAALSRLYVETAFALGETPDACRAADALLEGRDTPYWLRARAACLAFDGAVPAAELTAELARASDEAAPVFDALLDAYILDRPAPARARASNGLELALAAAAAPSSPLTVAEGAPVWLARAAERSGPEISLPSSPAEALDAARAMDGAEGEAALGALIQQDADRDVAAEALALRLAVAHEAQRFVDVARAYGEEVASLPINTRTLVSGEAFALAALLAGDVQTARRWRRALEQGPPPPPRSAPGTIDQLITQPDTGVGALRAMPTGPALRSAPEPDPFEPASPETLVRLDLAIALAENGLRRSDFQALLAARAEAGGADRLREAAALTALGARPVEGLAQALSSEGLPGGANPAAGFIAARTGARGEAMLHAARLLEAAPQSPSAAYLAARVLADAGLQVEALRLVLEMVAEGGP